MINSIEYVQSTNSVTKQKKQGDKVNQTSAKKPSKGDCFVSNNPKVNIKNALNDGSLIYTEATKLFGVIPIRDAFYTYSPQKNETIGEIKRKFGIKNGVIKDMNNIDKDDYCPFNNGIYEIYFRLDE